MNFPRRSLSALAACAVTAAVWLPAGTAGASVRSATSDTWAGYVAKAPKGTTFKNVGVDFIVPAVKCSGSVGPASKSTLHPGWHAAFWAGLDGWNPTKKVVNGTVQQAGVIAFCKTKNSVATYAAFYEMFPAGPILDKHVVVHAGDRFGVIVGVRRGVYSFALNDFTDNTDDYPTARCAKGTTCRDATAEVITEAPGGGPDAGNGIADTGTVKYTYAAAAPATQRFNATPLGKLPGLTRITMSPKGHPDLITVSKIQQGPNGPTDFKTFWK